MEKSDRISSAFLVLVPFKSSNHTFIRFFGLRFFSLPAKGRDKIVWSVRFRRARRTIIRRAAKSDAEKAKTYILMQESVRIPTPYQLYGTYKKTIIIAVFAFSVRTILADPQRGEIKSFGVFDFVAQGVQAYVVRRNRAQKKRKHQILSRNPSGFRPLISYMGHTKKQLS